MELIIADSVSKTYGGPAILDRQSFRVLAGDSIGLVGPNGAGKTTMARILSGQIAPDAGRLIRSPSTTTAYVEQSPHIGTEETVARFLLHRQERERRNLSMSEGRLAEATKESLAACLADYEQASARFDAAGGYDALDRGLAMLSALGLEVDAQQDLTTLSGGELSLLQLAEALVSRPDLLILDEPGNHLDYLGLAWLEQFLKTWNGTLIVISHNRYLLDSVCTKTWHLEWGRLTCFTGSYTSFRREWARNREEREHEYRRNDRKARELEMRVKELRSIASSQYNPPAQIMNKLSAAKRKLAETIEARGDQPQDERKVGVGLRGGVSRADIALSFDGLDLVVGGRTLLRGASLHVSCGERVALVGRNGCGKSSLLKRILRDGGWNSGPIRIGPSLEVGYLSQVPEFSRRTTIVEEVRSWGPLSVDQAYALVAPFLFEYADLSKPIDVLSGGEQNRLQFARLVYRNPSLLILDEPTNHMDIPSRESIEAALAGFAGTLLVVSHDRYFLDGLVDRVVEIDGAGLVSYSGDFTEFFAMRYPALPALSGAVERRGAERRKEEKRRAEPTGAADEERAILEKGSPLIPTGAATPRADATDLEAAIGRMEHELSELRAEIRQAGSSGRQKEKVSLEERADLLEERIEQAYSRWFETDG